MELKTQITFVPHSICVSFVDQNLIFDLICECVTPVHVEEESNKVKLGERSFPCGIGGSNSPLLIASLRV